MTLKAQGAVYKHITPVDSVTSHASILSKWKAEGGVRFLTMGVAFAKKQEKEARVIDPCGRDVDVNRGYLIQLEVVTRTSVYRCGCTGASRNPSLLCSVS